MAARRLTCPRSGTGRSPAQEDRVYIGLGTVVVILIIVVLILALRGRRL
jgi:hypothetical protein